MEQIWMHGKLGENHFSQLLLRIWKTEGSGRLEITKKSIDKRTAFHKGQLVIIKDFLDEEAFCDSLHKTKVLDSPSLKRCTKHAKDHKTSLLKTLIELAILTPVQLWDALEEYQREDLLPVFDWEQGEYFFDTEKPIHEHKILLRIHTPGFILDGIRHMKNEALLKSLAPEESKPVERLFPDSPESITLSTPEMYVISLIDTPKSLKHIYTTSELGYGETQKIICSLISLGFIGFPQKKKAGQVSPEIPKSEIYRILELFNEKCSFIFKYISKEIGPVALNILEKCLEDAKPSLSPIFEKARLGPAGKVETKSILKGGISLSREEFKVQVLNGLNDILVTEVLAVKRTLGNEHESTLVNHLKKIGEWN
ncbi:MAG: DUF4388 domain-containing protein [Candidatus Aminicenantaceae bacterium]